MVSIVKKRSEQSAKQLLLLNQNRLLSLALALLELLCRVFPLVLLLPLDSAQLIALDLGGLLDDLGDVSVAADALDLGHVLVSLREGLVVFERCSLSCGFDATAL